MMYAETFGGLGVGIMVFKTAYETALDDMSKGLDAVSDKLSKLASGDLRKAASANKVTLDDLTRLKRSLDDINSDLNKLNEIADRRRAALPAFVAWKNNTPFVASTPTGTIQDYGGGHLVVSKSADGFADLGEALKAGAITPLETGQRSTIDPSANVSDAMLARRFQGGQQS